jgi:hypothetical protein
MQGRLRHVIRTERVADKIAGCRPLVNDGDGSPVEVEGEAKPGRVSKARGRNAGTLFRGGDGSRFRSDKVPI